MEYQGMMLEEQEAARQARLNEVGTMPPCPFCSRPRVERSDYIRCNPCGVNWIEGTDWSKRLHYGLAQSIPAKATSTGIDMDVLLANENKRESS